MDLFHTASRMVINDEKLTISRANLEGHELRSLGDLFNFHCWSLDDRVKYLGFLFKTNIYRKTDWFWPLEKIEKKLTSWSHKWFARVGRLVLVKAVLEAMTIYWMALTWIPRGILDKIKRICFNFLWSGKQEKRVIPWARWECVALPKSLGGWGLRNIFQFSKYLAAKVRSCLLSTTSLWTKVV